MQTLTASHTAILLFSRTPQEEARVKTFHGQFGRRTNRGIARQLIKHSLRTARKTQLPVFPIYSPHQSGDSFGKRLSTACQQVFDLGYKRLIVIGNDCPTIQTQELEQVAHLLETQEWVLGPSSDGGIYLLGLQQSAFHTKALEEIPWHSEQVFQALCAIATGSSYSVLAEKEDIDTQQDFIQFLHTHAYSALGIRLQALCIVPLPYYIIGQSLVFPTTVIGNHSALRAPPLSA